MTEPDAKRASRGVSADMSPAAILRRLEIVGELSELASVLARAERVGPAAQPPPRADPAPGSAATGRSDDDREDAG
ncbi:MAG: hypothetical protein IPM29_15785 [Planctomycetes bacterium]|nr:hypothetical protein [Planctomycetota bacterium]